MQSFMRIPMNMLGVSLLGFGFQNNENDSVLIDGKR
jgi:hypothetical protein